MTKHEETWWCFRCNESYIAPLRVSEVRCKKGHRMKKATTESEIAREKAQEGVK